MLSQSLCRYHSNKKITLIFLIIKAEVCHIKDMTFFNKTLAVELSLSPIPRKKKGKKRKLWYVSAWLLIMPGWYAGKAKMPKKSLILPCTRCRQTQDHSHLQHKQGISSSISLLSRVTENRDVTVRQPLSSSYYHWCVPLNWTSKYSSVAMEVVGRAVLPQYTKGNR